MTPYEGQAVFSFATKEIMGRAKDHMAIQKDITHKITLEHIRKAKDIHNVHRSMEIVRAVESRVTPCPDARKLEKDLKEIAKDAENVDTSLPSVR